jgi:catechol 2,3-dioxygenase-like lactoylglutathione lyase family enzyme
MERAVPILPADDLAAAKAFYIDKLGFRVTFEASEDGHVGLLGLERGAIQLTLDSPVMAEMPAYHSRWTTRMPTTVSGAKE